MVMDSIREGVKKPWAKIVIFAIVISFVGAGYFTSALIGSDPFAAATVNGESISTQEFQRSYNRTRQQYGEAFKQFVKTDEQERDFRENVLQSLISRTVALQTSQALGMRVSNAKIRETLQAMPALQSEGAYSSDLLDQALRNIQMSREAFKRSLVSDLVLGQLSSGISSTEFVLSNEKKGDYQYVGQKRTGRALPIKYSLFDAATQVSDEEIQAYYDENKEKFRVDEKVSLDYLELSVDLLQQNEQVSDEQVAEYYNENIERFQSDEKRRVSHILISTDDGDDAALEKASQLKVRLDSGEDFATLVKSDSSDEFSAETGGDLGFVATGDQEEAFETAMNNLVKIGDVSAPVKTSFGYHLIKLTELAAGETQTIEEVKTQILQALKRNLAEESFYAKTSVLEEKSYEISDSLEEVSKLIDVDVKTTEMFGQFEAKGIFSNSEVLEASFSENVVAAGMNSNMINISDTHVVVVRLNKHQPSEVKPLDTVNEEVTASLKNEKSRESAIAFGDSIKQNLRDNQDVSSLITDKGLVWKDLDAVERTSAALPYLQLQEFFKLKKPEADAYTINSMEDAREYVVFVLNSVELGDINTAKETVATQTVQRLSRFYGDAIYGSLIEDQRNQAEVSRNEDNISR
jgi:peptidyl-prolyl cis-trans isomerase D